MSLSNETIISKDNFVVKIHIPGIKYNDITLKLVDNFWKLVIISDTFFDNVKLEFIKDLSHFDNTLQNYEIKDDYLYITFKDNLNMYNQIQING